MQKKVKQLNKRIEKLQGTNKCLDPKESEEYMQLYQKYISGDKNQSRTDSESKNNSNGNGSDVNITFNQPAPF